MSLKKKKQSAVAAHLPPFNLLEQLNKSFEIGDTYIQRGLDTPRDDYKSDLLIENQPAIPVYHNFPVSPDLSQVTTENAVVSLNTSNNAHNKKPQKIKDNNLAPLAEFLALVLKNLI